MRVLLPGVLSREECVAAIDAAETSGFEAMERRYPSGYRDNDRAVRDDAALAARLFERLRGQLPERWEEGGGRWRLDGLNPRFRFCRYREGQQFTKHRDGAWARSPGERSWLTVMLYLNDAGEFEGGATRFYEGERVAAVAARAGQAIVFDHRLWHDGEAVSGGVKYVMRTDVMYREELPAHAAVPGARGGLEVERQLRGHTGYVWALARRADGSLVSGSRDCTVRAWGEGEVLREGLDGSVTALAEVGTALWVGGRQGRIDDGQRSWQAHEGAVLGLQRLTDGAVASCGADGVVRRWSAAGELLGTVGRHDGWVWGLAVEGERLIAAVEPVTAVAPGARGDRRGRIELDSGRSWSAHDGAVCALGALGDGWVSGGEDEAVRLWSASGELRGEGFHGDFVRTLVVLGTRRFATGSYDGTIVIWRVSGSGNGLRHSPAADH